MPSCRRTGFPEDKSVVAHTEVMIFDFPATEAFIKKKEAPEVFASGASFTAGFKKVPYFFSRSAIQVIFTAPAATSESQGASLSPLSGVRSEMVRVVPVTGTSL